MKAKINNILKIGLLVSVVLLSGCKEDTYKDPFPALDSSNFELTYNQSTIPVTYNLGQDTLVFNLIKPSNFRILSGAYYRMTVDTIIGDSTAYIGANLKVLKSILQPTSAFAPFQILYPSDALDGTLRIDFKNLKNKSDVARSKPTSTFAYFKKGKYKVYLKLVTPNGMLYNRTSSINFEVPSISISATTNLSALNIANDTPVEGIFKVASDDIHRSAVTIQLDSPDFEISETPTSAPSKTPVTTFKPVASGSVTYEAGVDLYTKPIYVRLKNSFTIGTIKTGTITVTHDGQTPIVVNIKGEVKP